MKAKDYFRQQLAYYNEDLRFNAEQMRRAEFFNEMRWLHDLINQRQRLLRDRRLTLELSKRKIQLA